MGQHDIKQGDSADAAPQNRISEILNDTRPVSKKIAKPRQAFSHARGSVSVNSQPPPWRTAEHLATLNARLEFSLLSLESDDSEQIHYSLEILTQVNRCTARLRCRFPFS